MIQNPTIQDAIPRLFVDPEKTFKENIGVGEEMFKNHKLLFVTARGRATSLCLDIGIALMRKYDKDFCDGKELLVTCFTDVEPNTKKRVTRIEIPVNNNKQREN